jgi:CPA2 family monovalent cation:H+ antiporter-2
MLGTTETANGPAATIIHQADIFILGYGPAGSEVARQLQPHYEQRIAVLDLNRECIERAEEQKFESYIGDVRQIEILKHHGIANAKLVIITIPSFEASVKAIHNVKRLAPDAYILVRSRYEVHKEGFQKAGAHEIFNEEFTVGQKLGESALRHLKAEISN